VEQTQDTRIATFIQLSPILGCVIDYFLPVGFSLWLPLGAWLLFAKTDFDNWHGREAVRWQVMTSLYTFIFVALIFAMFVFGAASSSSTDPDMVGWSAVFGGMISIALLIILRLACAIIWPIIAAVKAHRGQRYVFPFVFSPRRNSGKDALAS